MKKIFLLVLLLMLPLVFGQSDVFTREEMRADIELSSEFEIKSLGENSRTDSIKVDVTLFPREDEYQSVESFDTTPAYFKKNNSGIKFLWIEPETDELDFSVSSVVRIKQPFVKVTKKIGFPIMNLPPELREYIFPQDNIDSDEMAIAEQASEIVEGEDDFYGAVFKLASWIEDNIVYSLDTLTSDISQKASWVLDKRYGVCDELTSLFVAMARSVGIPARYISGVAYTNWNNLNDWGPHAWAEVYFPEVGWIPFDITYGEFGFVDASHIKLKETLDSDEASVNYRWDGWMVDLKTYKLRIKTTPLEYGKKLEPVLDIKTSVLKEDVKFGSSNLVEVELSNPHDYYVPTEVFISRSTGLEVLGNNRQQVLLKPQEKRTIYWIINVDDSFDRNYLYTFQILAHTTRNASSGANFTSSIRAPFFSKDSIESVLEQRSMEAEKRYSREVRMNCLSDKRSYYEDEEVLVSCYIGNEGNIYLRDILVCMLEKCEKTSLGITQEKKLDFHFNFSEFGKKEIDVIARSEDISKSWTVKFEILDKPKVGISDLSFPENVSYGETYSISFTLNKISDSSPQNVNVALKHKYFTKDWEILEFSQDRKFILSLNSRELDVDKNDFIIEIGFVDKNNRQYRVAERFSVEMEDISVIEKALIFLNNLGRSLSEFDLKMLIIVAFAFGAVVGFIFRKGRRKIKD